MIHLIIITSCALVIYFNSEYHYVLRELIDMKLFNCLLCFGTWISIFVMLYYSIIKDDYTNFFYFPIPPILAVLIHKKINEV